MERKQTVNVPCAARRLPAACRYSDGRRPTRCCWCDRDRIHDDGECAIDRTARAALRAYAIREGRQWKTVLLKRWKTGHINDELAMILAKIGPEGITQMPPENL